MTFEQRVMHSTVKMTVSLDAGADALRYQLEVDWHEISNAQDWNPVLSFRLPLSTHADALLNDVPGGWARREAREMDVPALTGACAISQEPTAALITDCKYGFRLADDTLSVTLINTSGTPDPYPERGIHPITLYVALTDGDPTHLRRKAEALLRPMTPVPTAAHAGSLAPRQSLLGFDAAHSVLTSVRIAEDGALAIRTYEADGRDDSVSIRAPFPIDRATMTDLDGQVLAPVQTGSQTAIVNLGPHKLAEVRLYRSESDSIRPAP